MDIVSLILRMRELQGEIDELDECIKLLRSEYDKLRLIDIPNAMAESSDIRSLTGEFGRCTLTSDLHVKVIDNTKLHEWLKGNGNGSLIVPTVNAQTLKAFVKEQMVSGEVMPEEILSVSPFSRAVLYAK